MKIPESHPRYESLRQRERMVKALEEGYLATAGLIAHGRGEAFDYLVGEKTLEPAEMAEKVGVGLLLLAEHPVISVNGNTAALAAKEIVELSGILNAKLEVNLFYRTLEREMIIKRVLKENGASEVLGVGNDASERIPGLDSERGRVDPGGIWKADVVLVPLEDGDRTEALVEMGKKVIAIDLNPLSRTSQRADVTIVDNVVRAIPNMVSFAGEMKNIGAKELKNLIQGFDNKKNLNEMLGAIYGNLR
ncbi:MAG: hypothetical protein A7316_09510 [Candidatus Altiarchaeales archaeon WOR_SM1_86-2]|nr:MAG: hypothetical protein A7316_09510 [Candidatus Altiarchaeales archaeon WOR_SM1_86-2]ODS41404.1 MAG: hypothetical protein A7315_15200 [Candidatus Altiarchaeales archaeon WOR_SM1_79]